MSMLRAHVRVGVLQRDPDVRRELVRHSARLALRSNLLSVGLIAMVLIMLREAGLGVWLWAWAAFATAVLVAFDAGIRWCLRCSAGGGWSPRSEAVFGGCFAISGLAWGGCALLPLPGAGHATHQATVAGVTLMAVAVSLVFGSAANVAFVAFHATVCGLGVCGFLLDGNPELALLVCFAAIACLPLRGELAVHTVAAIRLARENVGLVAELRAERAAVQLANQRLLEANVELARRATRDPLTGLANRDLFAEHLTAALARRRRDGRQVSVIYLDLDHFKQVNDTYGHAAGDDLLCEVADRVASQLREADLCGRLGGDEFAVVAVTGTRVEAAELAERIRDCFELPFPVAGRPLVVACSVGLASARDGDAADALVQMADVALYRAKRHGRNQVQAWVPAAI